ncbi:MAG: hypothetical protein F4W92_07310 [Gammaproteobacteria bacterium]|nr:hypothetical protein [Gammaproteobacteria bacterium]
MKHTSSLSHLVGVISAQGVDGDEEKPEDPRPERKLSYPSQEWGIQLDKITAAIEAEEFDSAKEMLDRQLERTRRWTDRELAIFHQRYLDLALLTFDYELALEQAEKVLEYREDISYNTEERVLWTVGTIYTRDDFEGQDFEKALDYLQQNLDLKLDWEETSDDYAFIGAIYNFLNDFYKVEEWMLRATAKAIEEGKKVKSTWWEQLWQAYRVLADELMDSPTERDSYLQKALNLSQFLVLSEIEEKEFWTKMASDYAKIAAVATESNEDAGPVGLEAYYTIEAAYHFGLYEEAGEYKNVFSVLRVQGVENRAAMVYKEGLDLEIVERNFDNLFEYGEALYYSTDLERAAEVYEQAVDYKEDATVLQTLTNLHLLLDNFEECISFADRALNATEGELGDETDQARIKYDKGVCQFYNDDLDESETTMEELREEIGNDSDHDVLERLWNSAGQYLDLIKAERKRIQYKKDVDEAWREYEESKKRS